MKQFKAALKIIGYFFYFFSIPAFVLVFFGFLIKMRQQLDAFHIDRGGAPTLSISAFFFFMIVLTGYFLARVDGRRFIFANLFVGTVGVLLIYGCELVARSVVPAWPAIGLHGAEIDAGRKGWGRAVRLEGAMGFNSWGQRDLERTLVPRPGVTRIAFVGDSYLEESSTIPLSVVTQQKLSRRDVEVINLGISATDTDEYFYRIKNIAIPLKAKQVVILFYIGNDFINWETLPTFHGIVATYPRDSLFSLLGLRALNHLAMNKYRPVINAWGKSGQLNAQEENLHQQLVSKSNDDVLTLLASRVDAKKRAGLVQVLRQKQLDGFVESLRHPDQGLFRSYFFNRPLNYLAGDHSKTKEVIQELCAFRWIKKAADLCKSRQIKFSVVVIPLAFMVDPRMNAMWQPLVDMDKVFSAPQLAVIERFMGRCRQEGIVTLDLYGSLKGIPGTYLNPDGHFSDLGVQHVAQTLADFLHEN